MWPITASSLLVIWRHLHPIVPNMLQLKKNKEHQTRLMNNDYINKKKVTQDNFLNRNIVREWQRNGKENVNFLSFFDSALLVRCSME